MTPREIQLTMKAASEARFDRYDELARRYIDEVHLPGFDQNELAPPARVYVVGGNTPPAVDGRVGEPAQDATARPPC